MYTTIIISSSWCNQGVFQLFRFIKISFILEKRRHESNDSPIPESASDDDDDKLDSSFDEQTEPKKQEGTKHCKFRCTGDFLININTLNGSFVGLPYFEI